MQTVGPRSAGRCTRPKNNTPAAHTAEHRAACAETHRPTFLSARFLSSLPSHSHSLPLQFQASVTSHISITGDGLVAPRLSKSPKRFVLAKTHVLFQNPVMCYNVAQSRVLYLSSDCHFSYISVIQLMYRGLGKRTLGDPAELSSDSRLNLSRLSPRLKRHAHKHASATGPQRRVGGGVGWWAGVGVRGAGG